MLSRNKLPGCAVEFIQCLENRIRIDPSQQFRDVLQLPFACAMGTELPCFFNGRYQRIIEWHAGQSGGAEFDQIRRQGFQFQGIAAALAFADGQWFLRNVFLAFHNVLNEYFSSIRGY